MDGGSNVQLEREIVPKTVVKLLAEYRKRCPMNYGLPDKNLSIIATTQSSCFTLSIHIRSHRLYRNEIEIRASRENHPPLSKCPAQPEIQYTLWIAGPELVRWLAGCERMPEFVWLCLFTYPMYTHDAR